MKTNLNTILQPKYETVKFKNTGNNISFEMKSSEVQNIENSNSSIESYLQTMYAQYQKSGNVDSNNDGYLDVTELITSKRFVIAEIDSDKNINFSISSLQDIVKDDKKATQIMGYILKDMGFSDGKIPVTKDFLEYLAIDTNRDTVISNKEILKDIQTTPLSITFKNFLIEQILAMIKKDKDKALNGITQGAFNSSTELNQQSKTLNKLIKDDGKLTELLKRKEKLNILEEYANTLADNVTIFSLEA